MVRSARISRDPAVEALKAELEAYNEAFLALELPWQWDEATLKSLKGTAASEDCVVAYVERYRAHLLKVYDREFLRNLVHAAKERCAA